MKVKINLKNRIKQFIRPFSFKESVFKIYLNLDMMFYWVNFDNIPHNIVYEEEELYDRDLPGIPAFLNFQIPRSSEYNSLTDVDLTKLKPGDKYALIKFDHDQFLQTKTVANLQTLSLDRIEIFNHLGEMISICRKEKLEVLGFIKHFDGNDQ